MISKNIEILSSCQRSIEILLNNGSAVTATKYQHFCITQPNYGMGELKFATGNHYIEETNFAVPTGTVIYLAGGAALAGCGPPANNRHPRRPQVFDLRVVMNKDYNPEPGTGIEKMTFRNVRFNGGWVHPSRIYGYDETGA